MKKLLKIGLALSAAFFIFMAGLSIGFAAGAFTGFGSAGRFDHVRADRIVNDRMFIEEDVARFFDETIAEEVRGIEAAGENIRGEFVVQLENDAVIVQKHGRFGPDVTIIPPIPPIPEIPEIPAVPAAPIVVHHGGFSIFSFIGSLIRTFFAIAFILVGVWFIVRRSRQPVEKSPKA